MPTEYGFFPQPNLRPINDNEFCLWEPFEYEWLFAKPGSDKPPTRYKLIVYKYFITDIASIPRIFWSLLNLKPDGQHRAAALIHDFLYAFRGNPPPENFLRWDEDDQLWTPAGLTNKAYRGQSLTREEIDDLFFQIMYEHGVPQFKAGTMRKAVRVFGGIAW